MLLGAAAGQCGPSERSDRPPPRIASARLTHVGPRLVSNQTEHPIQVYGENLTEGLVLRLGAPVERDLPLVVVDDRHAFGKIPAGIALPPDQVRVPVTVKLGGGPRGALPTGEARIQIVNDTGFPDPMLLVSSRDGGHLFALSPTTDTLLVLDPASGRIESIPTGDGPRAIAPWTDAAGREWMVVAHEFAPEL